MAAVASVGPTGGYLMRVMTVAAAGCVVWACGSGDEGRPGIQPGCYGATEHHGVLAYDLYFRGPINTAGNSDRFSSTDGSCSGGGSGADTIVHGDTSEAAAAECATLHGSGTAVEPLSSDFPQLPAGTYRCVT